MLSKSKYLISSILTFVRPSYIVDDVADMNWTHWVLPCKQDLMAQSHCAEPTPERGRIDHSNLLWGQSILIHSNSVLHMHIWLAGEYESFEHVQKLCVASANKFDSCLWALKTCIYRVCRTAYALYSSHSHYILNVFWLFLLYTRSFVHVSETGEWWDWGIMRMDQKTVRMEMECARDCCKVDIRVHIHVNSPLSYTWHVDSNIFLLFSYSIRFILVRSCEILGRTEQCSYYFRTFNHAQLKKKTILCIWPFEKEE